MKQSKPKFSYHNCLSDYTLVGLKTKLTFKKKQLAGKSDNSGIKKMKWGIQRLEKEIKKREKAGMAPFERINNNVTSVRHH